MDGDAPSGNIPYQSRFSESRHSVQSQSIYRPLQLKICIMRSTILPVMMLITIRHRYFINFFSFWHNKSLDKEFSLPSFFLKKIIFYDYVQPYVL